MTIQQFDLVKLEAITAIQQDLENTVEAFSLAAENASTLAIAANEAAEAAASASGNILFYDTKTAANSALSGLSEGQIVEVMADESVSGLRTRYRKTSDAYVFKIIIGDAKVSSVTTLRAIPYSAMLTTAQTLGVSTAGDGGGGLWRWDAASTATDDTGTVITPTGHVGAGRWVRVRDSQFVVNALWFGADPTGVADSTAAINAAMLNTPYVSGKAKVVELPAGTYKVTSLLPDMWVTLRGDGWGTKIVPTTGYDAIVSNHKNYVTLQGLRIYGNGISATGRGVYFNGGIEITIEDVFVWYMTGHGIEFHDATGATAGAYPVKMTNVSCCYNGGNGLEIRATGGTSQMNAVTIEKSTFDGNTGNGVGLWGVQQVLKNCTLQVNGGYGVYLKTRGSTSADGAADISIHDNYINGNVLGNVYADVDTATITGLSIRRNRFQHSTLSDIAYKSFSIKTVSTYVRRIKGFEFSGNNFIFNGTSVTPTVYADFGNGLLEDCRLSFINVLHGSLSYAFDSQYLAAYEKYVNPGAASIAAPKSIVLNGKTAQSGITYSDFVISDNLSVGTHVGYFLLNLPNNAQIIGITANGETDGQLAVSCELQSRAYNVAQAYNVIGSSANRPMYKGGYGFTNAEAITISSIYGTGTGATGTATVSSGSSLSGVAIVGGGSGYVNNELVTITSTYGAGGRCIGVATVTAGVITSVALSNYAFTSFMIDDQSAFNTRSKRSNLDWLAKITVVNDAATIAKLGSIVVWYV